MTVQVGEYGIQETLDLIGLGLAIGSAFGLSFADDGKLTALDIPKFLPAVLEIPAAFEGATVALKELGELSEVEAVAIKEHVLLKGASIPGIDAKWLEYARAAFLIAQAVVVFKDAMKAPASE